MTSWEIEVVIIVHLNFLLWSLSVFRMISRDVVSISDCFCLNLVFNFSYFLVNLFKGSSCDNFLKLFSWNLVSSELIWFNLNIAVFLNILETDRWIGYSLLFSIFDELNEGTVDNKCSYFIFKWLFIDICQI